MNYETAKYRYFILLMSNHYLAKRNHRCHWHDQFIVSILREIQGSLGTRSRQVASINRVLVLNISIDKSRSDRGDRSPLPRHYRKDHTVDADNFIILSLTIERGRSYYHLAYRFLEMRFQGRDVSTKVNLHSPRESNEVLSFMLISLVRIHDNDKPRGWPRINGRPWIARRYCICHA